MFQNVHKDSNCHEKFKNVQKCSKMLKNVTKCSKMFENVQKCLKHSKTNSSKMFKKNTFKRSKLFKNVEKIINKPPPGASSAGGIQACYNVITRNSTAGSYGNLPKLQCNYT